MTDAEFKIIDMNKEAVSILGKDACMPRDGGKLNIAVQLVEELANYGYLSRLKNIPHYGPYRVRKQYDLTRYQYVCQQIRLHQRARSIMQNRQMDFTYGSTVMNLAGTKVSLLDAEIILSIVTNIGHFRNTFTSSRAAIQLCEWDQHFSDMLISASGDPRFRDSVKSILESRDYRRFHLINGLTLLEKCDGNQASVKAAKELLYLYLHQPNEVKDEKGETVLRLFRQIRDIVFLKNDLSLAPVPIRLTDDHEAVSSFLKEMLEKYNDKTATVQMIQSLKKLLDDSFYMLPDHVFREEEAAGRMARSMNHLKTMTAWTDIVTGDHPLNRKCDMATSAASGECLKLTLQMEHHPFELYQPIQKQQYVSTGFYLRGNDQITFLITNRKQISDPGKTAYGILRKTVSAYGFVTNQAHVFLAAKFFFSKLFSRKVEIGKEKEDCEKVFVARGSAARRETLQRIIDSCHDDEDRIHEMNTVLRYLETDRKNDTAVIIPCDILAFENDTSTKTFAEFDGAVIYPFRTEKQIILLEAKNRRKQITLGKKELISKLNRLSLEYDENGIHQIGHDAYYEYSI